MVLKRKRPPSIAVDVAAELTISLRRCSSDRDGYLRSHGST